MARRPVAMARHPVAMARGLLGSALQAAMVLAVVVTPSRCASGQDVDPLAEVMSGVAWEWYNKDLADLTCDNAPDALECNANGQVVAMQLNGASNETLATIPACIGNLTTLTYLNLAENAITGSIPESFSKLSLLKSLDLSTNFMKQPIDVLAALTSLTHLNMSGNLIRAPLSPAVGQLPALVHLDFANNLVDDVKELSALTNLKYLSLHDCAMGSESLRTFSTLTALQFLDLRNNTFEGSLDALTTLTRLQYLSLAYNSVTGSIPAALTRLSMLTFLELAINGINGPVDTVTAMTALRFLSFYQNNFSGSFPVTITRLVNLTYLDLGYNRFSGSVPESLGQMSNLRYLDLGDSSLQGSVPASLGNLTNLENLWFINTNATTGPSCGVGGACVVDQNASTSFCSACPAFCQSCSPPGLCVGCKESEPQPEQSTGGSGLSTGALIGIIVGGVVVLLLAVIGVGVFFYLRRMKRASRFGALAKGVCVEYTMKEMEQATNSWADSNLLGSGGFGDVYKGVSPDDGTTLWAVKRAKVITNDFQREVSEMATKHHPNLVRLLGYATCGDLRDRIEQVLVYEFISNGDLHRWLSKDAPSPLTLKQRLDIIIGAAHGFEYLHGFDIVHRDIKPANILIDGNMQPKVADFGLVRVEGGTTVVATRVMGTPGYVDPAYSRTQKATPATDVYSFGILMLGVLTGKTAIFEEGHRTWSNLEWVQEKLAQGAVDEIADPSMGDDRPPTSAVQRIADLAIRCTATFTADRPTMARIACEMEALRAEVCGGEEDLVHRAHRQVDEELKESMEQEREMNAELFMTLTGGDTGSMMGITGDMGGMSTPEVQSGSQV
ncbi:hypothetical protein CLOM_g18804 [Closterium sp. NIES-68]|nr:hypothetical protein CLOM_g18804 [Closterium sp. NIES-68]GJP80031.1 hypothetical protein CLOP_g10270 [Closterium sp. NIES-67]